MLLSAGDFAIYHAETHVFEKLHPAFGDLSGRRRRERLLDVWLPSRLFSISGLDAAEFRERIMMDCRTCGDFLRIFMEAIAARQNVTRWAECTPAHVLWLPEIKRQIPEARVIHIIRDGRDVALSLAQLGWIRPAPWHRNHKVLVAGLFWEWVVRRGQQHGRRMAEDYMEVRYEDLVQSPAETLQRLAPFVDHDLAYDRILEAGVGSVRRPNTAFGDSKGDFQPVGRWKKRASEADVVALNGILGRFLEELGYAPETDREIDTRDTRRLARMRRFYHAYFSSKNWLKRRAPLGRWLVDVSRLSE